MELRELPSVDELLRSGRIAHLGHATAVADSRSPDTPENVKIAGVRIAPQCLLHLQCQPVHAFPHVRAANPPSIPEPDAASPSESEQPERAAQQSEEAAQ